jgi:hypothetical protein
MFFKPMMAMSSAQLGSVHIVVSALLIGNALSFADAIAPQDASNFQGSYPCAEEVRIGRPRTQEDVLALLSAYPRVKANGLGHSWWQEQFCSGNTSTALNMMMTSIEPKYILVNTTKKTVKVRTLTRSHHNQ